MNCNCVKYETLEFLESNRMSQKYPMGKLESDHMTEVKAIDHWRVSCKKSRPSTVNENLRTTSGVKVSKFLDL